MLIALKNHIVPNEDHEGHFFDFAFWGDLDPELVSSTSARITNLDSGAVTTLTGTGLAVSANGEDYFGTVTGWTTRTANGTEVTQVSGISWTLAELAEALVVFFEYDNDAPLLQLLNRQSIEIDASAATGPVNATLPLGIYAPVSSKGSAWGDQLYGSSGRDVLTGGAGNDRLNPGMVAPGYGDVIHGSGGSDLIDLRNVAQDGGWVELVYHQAVSGPISMTLDTVANTGSVTKSSGVDTILGVSRAASSAGGLEIYGTDNNDTFTIRTSSNDWMALYGGNGVDRYDLSGDGLVRISFAGNWHDGPSSAAQVNLGTGIIRNDGYGNQEQVALSGNVRVEVQGTRFADSLIGSDRSDRFIATGGNDTMDGGDGYDWVRYDRRQISTGVTINLTTGEATGLWNGEAFRHQLISIEDVRGSNAGDTIIGNSTHNILDGRNGDDTIYGGAGNDTLYGGAGNDILYGGAGDDHLYAGDGDDEVWGGEGNDVLYGGTGSQLLAGGVGNDTFFGGTGNTTIWAGPGNDVVYLESGQVEVWLGTGDSMLFGGAASGVLGGGSGNDRIEAGVAGQEMKYIWAGDGNDTVTGSDAADQIGGGLGNDVISAGGGNDTIWGAAGNDLIHGDGGNDLLYGGDGADTVYGDDGNDRIYLGAGADIGYGGAGNDTLNAGAGFDILYGGAGADVFEFWRGQDWTRIEDFSMAEGDRLALSQWMWRGTDGVLTEEQVLSRFGSFNASGDLVLNFANGGTSIVLVGYDSTAGLAGYIDIF